MSTKANIYRGGFIAILLTGATVSLVQAIEQTGIGRYYYSLMFTGITIVIATLASVYANEK